MRYRRVFVPGASYFFTLITHERARLFSDAANVDRWRRAVEQVRRTRPFVVEAEVVMLDHLHTIWTLPQADADYATRIRLIKTAFTKDMAFGDGVTASESRASKGERDVWQRRYWEHVIRDERDFQATSTISTSIRSSTESSPDPAIGPIRLFASGWSAAFTIIAGAQTAYHRFPTGPAASKCWVTRVRRRS